MAVLREMNEQSHGWDGQAHGWDHSLRCWLSTNWSTDRAQPPAKSLVCVWESNKQALKLYSDSRNPADTKQLWKRTRFWDLWLPKTRKHNHGVPSVRGQGRPPGSEAAWRINHYVCGHLIFLCWMPRTVFSTDGLSHLDLYRGNMNKLI